MSSNLLIAFALVLVFEGMMPLLAPKAWRETFRRLIEFTDGQVRFVGLASMLAGIILLMVFQ